MKISSAIIDNYQDNAPSSSNEYRQLLNEMQGMRKDLKESAPQVTAILNERGVWAITDRKQNGIGWKESNKLRKKKVAISYEASPINHLWRSKRMHLFRMNISDIRLLQRDGVLDLQKAWLITSFIKWCKRIKPVNRLMYFGGMWIMTISVSTFNGCFQILTREYQFKSRVHFTYNSTARR